MQFFLLNQLMSQLFPPFIVPPFLQKLQSIPNLTKVS